MELLSTAGRRLCSLPDLPAARWGHSQNGLLTCGGGAGTPTPRGGIRIRRGRRSNKRLIFFPHFDFLYNLNSTMLSA